MHRLTLFFFESYPSQKPIDEEHYSNKSWLAYQQHAFDFVKNGASVKTFGRRWMILRIWDVGWFRKWIFGISNSRRESSRDFLISQEDAEMRVD